MTTHIEHLIKKSNHTMYLLHTLRQHGLETTSINDVFHALLLNRLHYAVVSWRFLASHSNIECLDKIVKCMIHYGYCHDNFDQVKFNTITDCWCQMYFEDICHNQNHVLHSLLPPQIKHDHRLHSSQFAFATTLLQPPHDKRNYLIHMIFHKLKLD